MIFRPTDEVTARRTRMSALRVPANVGMLPEEAKMAPWTRRSVLSPSALVVPSMTETAVSSAAPTLFALTECTER